MHETVLETRKWQFSANLHHLKSGLSLYLKIEHFEGRKVSDAMMKACYYSTIQTRGKGTLYHFCFKFSIYFLGKGKVPNSFCELQNGIFCRRRFMTDGNNPFRENATQEMNFAIFCFEKVKQVRTCQRLTTYLRLHINFSSIRRRRQEQDAHMFNFLHP